MLKLIQPLIELGAFTIKRNFRTPGI